MISVFLLVDRSYNSNFYNFTGGERSIIAAIMPVEFPTGFRGHLKKMGGNLQNSDPTQVPSHNIDSLLSGDACVPQCFYKSLPIVADIVANYGFAIRGHLDPEFNGG